MVRVPFEILNPPHFLDVRGPSRRNEKRQRSDTVFLLQRKKMEGLETQGESIFFQKREGETFFDMRDFIALIHARSQIC